MNEQHLDMNRKVTMTVSCPLGLYLWLKQSQRNVSAYVVQATEAQRNSDDNARGGQS